MKKINRGAFVMRLPKRSAAIVLHADGSSEVAVPRIGDDDYFEADSPAVRITGLAVAIRDPQIAALIAAKLERLRDTEEAPDGEAS